MKLRVLAVGKVREAYVRAAVDDFARRIERTAALEIVEVASAHGGDPARAVARESERVLRVLEPHDAVWLLERTGDELSSVQLSAKLAALANAGTSRLTLVVAGAYGASPALLARADFRWSLSKLTFLHEWARALVLEQLYRCAKIERNEPYHH